MERLPDVRASSNMCGAHAESAVSKSYIPHRASTALAWPRAQPVSSPRLEPVHNLIQTVQTPRMREKNYPSDVSRERFEQIRPILEQARKRTKPVTVDMYEVWCAVLYLLRTGCPWRALPSDFPKWRTVHSYFAKWSEVDDEGMSLLERALKKSGWRGPRETGAQGLQYVLDRGRAEREEQ
ncbi:transposase [Xanthomonas oryzae pv. oryzae]|uniref:Transposase n=2 Tax=Xanthomonas oryzae pv. oryzae TaxID=64187 RepID=Q5H0Z9_XANOR|nr:putative transposase [Xanthomonas oryzae pv. oryzae KACC 10331]AXQ09682.1 transposase [Xanthomonas oryzae pv. oryzae]AXQ75607.1 transposase [Xanthomonas oryzae pv. oryzae]UMA60532.1 transposase [Xanthomonas oryzae pv. oryzae]